MGRMVDGVVSQGTPAKRERKQEKINRQADRFDVFSGTQKITLMVDGVVSQGTPAKRERKQEKINRQAD